MEFVTHEGEIDKLPERTRLVFNRLWLISVDGLLTQSLEELADRCELNRRTLAKHLVRLRRSRLLEELETVGIGAKCWYRVRRLAPIACISEKENFSIWRCTPVQVKPVKCPKQRFTGGPKLNINTYIHVCTVYLQRDYVSLPVNLSGFAARPIREEEDNVGFDEIEWLMSEGCDERRDFAFTDLPAYPSTKICKPVVVPRMPRLSFDKYSDGKLLIKAFKSAVQHRYGKRVRVDKQAQHRMRVASAAMVRFDVTTPHAWAAFRIKQWQNSENAKMPPALDYVFSAKVVDRHVDFYRSVEASYDVLRKIVLTPSHHELIDLWEQVRKSVSNPKLPSGGVVTREVVDRILPQSKYRRLVERTKQEQRTIKVDLYRQLANGIWVW